MFHNIIWMLFIGILGGRHHGAERMDQLPYGYLCYLSRISDCLKKVPSLPAEWNITNPMEYCKDQTRPRDQSTGELCQYDDPTCGPEVCPVPPLQLQNFFAANDGPLESVSVRRVMDRRHSFPLFLVKWLPLDGANFYVVEQWSDKIPEPYYYETKKSSITVPTWGSCTLNYIRVAWVVDSMFRFFSQPVAIYDEPRFPHEVPSRFDFLEAIFTNDTVTNDFLPEREERVIYVRVAFRLGIPITTYDIAQIGEATMFSPNCRLDFISLYPRPMKLPGANEFLFTFPETYAARNCTVAVKVHNLVSRCNQSMSTSTADQQQSSSAVHRAKQRLGIVPPPFLLDRLQALRQLRIRFDCNAVKNYDCRRAARWLNPSCGVTNVQVTADPEPGTYWLLWGSLLHPKNLPVKAWVILIHHFHTNDTMRFLLPTSDNAPPDYGNEFRSQRRLKVEFGTSRTRYRVQVCAIYDYSYDETIIDRSGIPEREIQLFDGISEGVSRQRLFPILAIEPAEDGFPLNDVAITRMEIVRRALSDRMIVALAIAVAMAVAIAVCVPFVLCSAARKRREHVIDVKLAPIDQGMPKIDVSNAVIKLSPVPAHKLEEDKY